MPSLSIPDELTQDKATPLDLLHECAEVLALLRDAEDTPRVDLAIHLLDLYLAAAVVAYSSTEHEVDISAGMRHLAHQCDTHIEAALLIIAAGHEPGAESSAEITRAGLAITRQLLAKE